MPFIAEATYKSLQNTSSVHLENWPNLNKKLIDKNLLDSMARIRKIASLALEARAKADIKVRQPLQKLKVKSSKFKINEELLAVLKDEINVKEIIFDPKIKDELKLDTKITPELKAEGNLRDLIRIVQDLRKEAGYTPKDKIYLWLELPNEIESAINKHLKDFKEKIGAKNVEFRRTEKFDAELETKIDNEKIWIGIKKV
jgi:isoleucyl-tRNA synthetase